MRYPRSALLAVVLCVLVASASVVSPTGPTVGDLNGDGSIGAVDALAVLSVVVGRTLPEGWEAVPSGDTNCDGGITALDALIILSRTVGRDVWRFCIGQPNISGWEFAFGDGSIPPTTDTSAADHSISHVDSMSTIVVNRRERPDVGLHGIYLFRRETKAALTSEMTFSIQFRLPDTVSREEHQAGTPTGQTIDFTLFSWDGASTRLDYGFAISIVTNPYLQAGQVRYWVTDSVGVGRWDTTGVVLDLDTEWHVVELFVDPVSDSGVAIIDGDRVVTGPRAKEAKPDFGNDVTARVSVEVISIDPGTNSGGRSAKLEIRNWCWIWSPEPENAG